KEVEEGCPGDGTVAFEALAREAGQPPLGSARLDLGHQARLADPGFAAEQDRLALALVGQGERALQEGQWGRAPDQGRAEHRSIRPHGQGHLPPVRSALLGWRAAYSTMPQTAASGRVDDFAVVPSGRP